MLIYALAGNNEFLDSEKISHTLNSLMCQTLQFKKA